MTTRSGLVICLLLGACSGTTEQRVQPSLTIDDVARTATITASASRQQATLAVTTTVPSLFGASLSKIDYRLDLGSVPNDDPAAYDIALVAACAKEIDLTLALDGEQAEALGSEQPSYHALSIDGCLLQPSGLTLRGQTNIHKLDAAHVDMTVFFSLTRGTETHAVAIEQLVLDF